MGKQGGNPLPSPGDALKGAAGAATTVNNTARNVGQSALDFWTGAPTNPNFQQGAEQQGAANVGAVNAQTQANRPGQNTPFGFTQWQQDANGNWTQNSGLAGPLGGAANSLNAQAANNLGTPMDFGALGKLDDGSAARTQAIDASFNAQMQRLNPMLANREDSMKTELLNQGLDPNTQAARGARSDFNAGRNDAISGAMNSAIREGTAAQQATFGQNMAARQQKLMEMLQQRGQPLAEMNALQGFTQMPGFMGAGQAIPAPIMQALMAQSGFDMNKWMTQQQMAGDMMAGYGDALQAGSNLVPGAGAIGKAFGFGGK